MDDEVFIEAILSSPEDDALRFIYADWLEERGDRRGEFLRLDHAMRQIPIHSDHYRSLWARRDDLRKQCDSPWLKRLFGHADAVRMAVVFYDNREPLTGAGVADLDRIYRFDWDRFGDAEWAVLAEAYPQLPGWAGCHPVPCWFGTDFEEPPYLWASVEPPGLQIGGAVPIADWLAWERKFGAAVTVAELPFRSLDEW